MKKKRKSAKKRALKRGEIGRLRAAAGDSILGPGGPSPGGLSSGGYFRVRKTQVTLRVDADVLAWFRKQGRGYQTRMNEVLREAMTEAGADLHSGKTRLGR